MKLRINERINLLEILPKENDFLTMKKIGELAKRLNFTDEEVKKYEIQVIPAQKGGQWTWNRKGQDYKADIEIGEISEKEIVEVLKKKNEEKQLKAFEVSLYGKFVEKNFEE